MKNRFVFSDFDGTLTVDDHITPRLFDLFSFLDQHQSELVIVTGRSLSWGQFLISHFPIHHAVVEGGAVIVYRQGDLIHHHCLVDEQHIQTFQKACEIIEIELPPLKVGADTYGRITDRAYPKEHLSQSDFKKMKKLAEEHDVRVGESNVHYHLGMKRPHFDKLTGVKVLCEEYLHVDYQTAIDQCFYFGDSLNDQAVFEGFKHSVGVSNVSLVLHRLDRKPAIILEGEENKEIEGVLNVLQENF